MYTGGVSASPQVFDGQFTNDQGWGVVSAEGVIDFTALGKKHVSVCLFVFKCSIPIT